MTDASQSDKPRMQRRIEATTDDPIYAAILSTRMPMIVTDNKQPDNPIVFANKAFCELTGYSKDEILGSNCRFLQGPETDKSEVARIREAVETGEDVASELLNYKKNGETFWNALFVSPVRNSDGEITHFFGSQLDVTRKRADQAALKESHDSLESQVRARTRALEETVEQKTALLHEVDHRVKNNLQLIASLIMLQARRIEDEEIERSLRDMLSRVSALSTVHRKLYQSGTTASFKVGEFIRDIADDLLGSTGRSDIDIRFELGELRLPASKASPVALIFNELITNALKHAFPMGRRGEVIVRMHRLNGDFMIEVEDNGVGIGDGDEPDGYGAMVIELLARQLQARIERKSANPGTLVRLVMPTELTDHAGEQVERDHARPDH